MAVVKIIVNDDGDKTGNNDWHLVDPANMQGNAALCSQEYFGLGESRVIFEYKKRGAITCGRCCRMVLIYKRVKLKTSELSGHDNSPEYIEQ